MTQLRHCIQIVGTLGLFHRKTQSLDLFAKLARLLHGGFFLLPVKLDALRLFAGLGELLAQYIEPPLAGLVLLLRERRLLDFETERLARELVELLRHRIHFGADHRAGLVHEIDGLVGQKAISDVAVRQRDRSDECVVLNAHAVVQLEALFDAA